MTDEKQFKRKLKANSEDDTTRLVFADWLQDRDDPRAEVMRGVIKLRDEVNATTGTMTLAATQKFSAEALRLLTIDPREDYVRQVLASALVRSEDERLRHRGALLAAVIDAFDDSRTLQEIQDRGNELNIDELLTIYNSPLISPDERTGNDYLDLNREVILRRRNEPEMREDLVLFGKYSVLNIVNAGILDVLNDTLLFLGGLKLREGGTQVIKKVADCKKLINLTRLYNDSDIMQDGDLGILMASTNLKNLEILSLMNSEITTKDVKIIAASPNMGNLYRLDLRENKIRSFAPVVEQVGINGNLRNLREFYPKNKSVNTAIMARIDEETRLLKPSGGGGKPKRGPKKFHDQLGYDAELEPLDAKGRVTRSRSGRDSDHSI